MKQLTDTRKSVIYVARDIERAIGGIITRPYCYIISNYSNFAKRLAKNKPKILLIKNETILDTPDLLEHPEAKKFVNSLPEKNILVFKPMKRIEKICMANNWRLLNPKSDLSRPIEEKITQLKYLREACDLFPKYTVTTCENIVWNGKPIIAQYNNSHTGLGTVLIENRKQFEAIQKKFPKRDVRITDYIVGSMFTNNNVVATDKILCGNISYQITGLPAFTDNRFATIGNDWALPKKILEHEQIDSYVEIALKLGHVMRDKGWKGLFGIDMIYDRQSKKWRLIEINARQPASASYESSLQLSEKKKSKLDASFITVFEAHIAALFDEKLFGKKIIPLTDGAQIVLRNKDGLANEQIIETAEKRLSKLGLKCVPYAIGEAGSDLLRIQSPHALMAGENTLNATCKKIEKFILNNNI